MAPQTTELPGTASFPSRTRRPRKTCVQCAKGKRKCDKTGPSCLRCRDRGIRCVYPPRFIPPQYEESESAVATTDEAEREASDAAPMVTSLARTQSQTVPTDTDTTTPNSRWFLSPGTWIRQPGWTAPQYHQLPLSEKSLPHFIDKLQGWVRNWVRDGHSPIMHRQLYEESTPECIEDAYTTLAAYHVAAPTTKTTALRVIENRVNKLLAQIPDEVDGICSALLLDTRTHLARTQALFMYQMIRLFDGDIRARAQAEGHIDILHRWSTQLLESAQLDCAAAEVLATTTANPSTETSTTMPASNSTNSTFVQANLNPSSLSTGLFPDNTLNTSNNPAPLTASNPFSHPPSPSPPTLYKTWLLSESIRRIYISSIFMQSVYKTLKQGWAICPGAIAFTAQSGLWDAPSCYSWMSILKSGGGKTRQQGGTGNGSSDGGGENGNGLSPWVMLHGLESWRILEGAVPGEVDEFAVAVAEISCGVERVEQWIFEKGRE